MSWNSDRFLNLLQNGEIGKFVSHEGYSDNDVESYRMCEEMDSHVFLKDPRLGCNLDLLMARETRAGDMPHLMAIIEKSFEKKVDLEFYHKLFRVINIKQFELARGHLENNPNYKFSLEEFEKEFWKFSDVPRPKKKKINFESNSLK